MSRYYNVQGLRGLAALAVVIGHASSLALISVPLWLAASGYSGVDLFFVISGFIICRIAIRHRSGDFAVRPALIFLLRRYWRIYPLYWIDLGFVAIVSLWMPLHPAYISCDKGILDYIFLLTTSNCYIPPAWTLQFELYFYTIFSALILFSPRNFYGVIGFLMLIQMLIVVLSGSAFDNSSFLSSPLILEFGAGCVVAWLQQVGFRRWPIPTLVLGGLFFALGVARAMHADPAPLPRVLTFGLGGALILYALVTLELDGKFILPLPIQKLGDASYSLYLWHWPLVTIFATVALGWYGIAAVVALSFMSYQFIEVPLMSVLKRILGAKPDDPAGISRYRPGYDAARGDT